MTSSVNIIEHIMSLILSHLKLTQNTFNDRSYTHTIFAVGMPKLEVRQSQLTK